MANPSPFDTQSARYDDWFKHNAHAYQSELLALRALMQHDGLSIEIGVGSGRFAAPLGIAFGLDPSAPMLKRAAARGISVVQGVAEALPFVDDCFDYVVMVTVLCFVTSPQQTLREVHRVLKPHGELVLAFIDRNSTLGHVYEQRKSDSDFYRDARFYSASEVLPLLRQTGFMPRDWRQTLTRPAIDAVEPAQTGYGSGAFVVVRAGVC